MLDHKDRACARQGSVHESVLPRALALSLCAGTLAGAILLSPAWRWGSHRRSAEEILRLHATVPYEMSCESELRADRLAFVRGIEASSRVECALGLELFENYPDHPEVPRVMGKRWHMLRSNLEEMEVVLEETDEVLASLVSPALRREALLARADSAIYLDRVPEATLAAYMEEAMEAWGEEIRPAAQLYELIARRVSDPAEQKEFCVRLIKRYRKSDYAIDSALRYSVLGRVGQTFEFDFEDVLTGRRVTTQSCRGRPVVLCMMIANYQIDADEGGPVRELAAWQRSTPSDTQVIGVLSSPMSEVEVTRRATAEHGIEWAVFHDGGVRDEFSLYRRVRPGVTPLFLLLDEEGRLETVSMRLATLFDLPSFPSRGTPR